MLMLFGFFNASAQDSQQLNFYFEADTLTVKQGKSFLNFIVLENLGNTEITVQDVGPKQKYPGLLLSTQSEYTLLPGETKRLPIKFLVNIDFMKMKSQQITYQLSYLREGVSENLEATFSFNRNEEKHIALYAFARESYISAAEEISTISMFVENRGFSPRSLMLAFQAIPDGLEIRPNKMAVTLEGQEKRLVEFNVSVRRQSTFYPDYNIDVIATDLVDNTTVGNTNLKVIVLSSNRQLVRGPGAEMGKNYAEVAYNGQRSGFNYMQLKANTVFELGKDTQATFNIATDYFMDESQYNLYDTWFQLKTEKSLYRLGNVFANDYDYSISGRGVLANTKIDDNKLVEVFALDNNYNLYGTNFPESEGSKLAGAKYKFGDAKKFQGKLSYVFDHNPRAQTDSQVANLLTAFVLDSLHRFKVETGVSHEKGNVNKEENTGISAGITYQTTMGKWDF
mgnify:CR=1 FL=1